MAQAVQRRSSVIDSTINLSKTTRAYIKRERGLDDSSVYFFETDSKNFSYRSCLLTGATVLVPVKHPYIILKSRSLFMVPVYAGPEPRPISYDSHISHLYLSRESLMALVKRQRLLF